MTYLSRCKQYAKKAIIDYKRYRKPFTRRFDDCFEQNDSKDNDEVVRYLIKTADYATDDLITANNKSMRAGILFGSKEERESNKIRASALLKKGLVKMGCYEEWSKV